MQQYSSKLIEQAVDQMATLPGVGRKTALRLVLDLLKRSPDDVRQFSDAFTTLRDEVQFCKSCNNISDADQCTICRNPSRDRSTICVVEDVRDVMAIEKTQQYKGLYHVLGGIISPMDGIGPEDLAIDLLVERSLFDEVSEIILALSATMEGDTTNFYIYRKVSSSGIDISTLSRGVAVGGELEYADEVTLGRSLVNRTPFKLSH